MNNAVRSTIFGAGVGAALMFIFDPARGTRRRALVRDKMRWAARKSRDAYEATRRDLGNRMSGMAAEVSAMTRHHAPDHRTIEQRVRAKLGRVSSHPRAIRVAAVDGYVTLAGDVLESEASRVEAAVSKVRGVQKVINQLRTHTPDEYVPSLQGASSPSSWIGGGWSPTARLAAAVGAATTFAVAAGLRRN